MPPTLCALLSGVDWRETGYQDVGLPDHQAKIDQAIADGFFSQPDHHVPGLFMSMGNLGSMNAGHVFGMSSTNCASLSQGMVRGRRLVQEYLRFYQKYYDLPKLQLGTTAAMMGIRESRRVICDYRLVLQDFLDEAVFPDEIGRYSYNIDIHANTVGVDDYELFEKEHTTYRYKPGQSYGIPYRTLPVKGFSNLLTAGRSICTDRYMQSSVRVMPGCYITGQAAGTAAAVCALEEMDVHQVPVAEVQKKLKKLGAYLPNFQE